MHGYRAGAEAGQRLIERIFRVRVLAGGNPLAIFASYWPAAMSL